MSEDDKSGFNLDIPVVADRRTFFETEAVVSGPPDDLETDVDPDELEESLRAMREAATRRTSIEPEPDAGRE